MNHQRMKSIKIGKRKLFDPPPSGELRWRFRKPPNKLNSFLVIPNTITIIATKTKILLFSLLLLSYYYYCAKKNE